MGFWEAVGWAGFAVIKFAITPSTMIAASYGFWEVWPLTSVAACIGATIFYFFGSRIFRYIDSKRKKPKRLFSKSSRRTVRLIRRFGLPGLAVLSLVLSVPIAGVLASKFFKRPMLVLPVLWIAFTSWAFLLTYLSETGFSLFNG